MTLKTIFDGFLQNSVKEGGCLGVLLLGRLVSFCLSWIFLLHAFSVVFTFYLF